MSSFHPQWSIERVGGLMSALILAGLVNLLILLLIDALVGHRSLLTPPAASPRPISFIRTVSKPPREEPKQVVTSERPAVSEPRDSPRSGGTRGAAGATASSRRPAVPQRRTVTKPAPQPAPRPVGPVRDSRPPAVPAPRIDIPREGTGAPLAPVAGSTPRVTGPPGHWNPGPGGRGGKGQGAASSGHGGTEGGGRGTSDVAVLSRVLPHYPESARSRRIEGWVSVELTIAKTGSVMSAKVIDASPTQMFDQAALEAVRRWKFKPAYRNGEPAEQRVRQTIRFRLDRR